MKKFMLRLLVLAVTLGVLAGCTKTEQDPYKHYRKYSSSELFERGEKALAKKHYDQASRDLEAIDALYPFSPNAEQAQLDLIYAYYMNGDPASSVTAADRFVRIYPRSPHVDYAYYMRGIVSLSQGLTWLQRHVGMDPGSRDYDSLRQSYKSFSTLIELYPQSRYTPDAKVRINYIRNLLAHRELTVAEFYYEREAYVAAANRAAMVVQHYPGAAANEQALILMKRSYDKLGLVDLANRSVALLRANFPNSSYLTSPTPQS